MSTAVSTQVVGQQDWTLIEKLVVEGDLSKLSVEERLHYYRSMCERIGLDPLSQPLQYLRLSNKLVLYVTKGATDQIARNRNLSRRITATTRLGDVYVVTAQAVSPDGRVEESTGAIFIGNLGGENLANAMLKAESKAKRRVTLSHAGLGWMDESEVESIPGAERVQMEMPTRDGNGRPNPHNANQLTGEIPARQLAAGRPAPQPQAPPVEQSAQATPAQMERLQGLLDTWEAMTGKKILPPEDAYAPVVLKWIASYEKRIAAYEPPAPVAATPAPVPQLVAVGAPDEADESPF